MLRIHNAAMLAQSDAMQTIIRNQIRFQEEITQLLAKTNKNLTEINTTQKQLQNRMTSLATEVEVMTTTADDWQTKANTVEEQLGRKIAKLKAQTKLSIAQIIEQQTEIAKKQLKAEKTVQGILEIFK
jgi:uncharacterized protein YlxW (UPF0749 family)